MELFGQTTWNTLIEIENVYRKEREKCISDLESNKYSHPQILSFIQGSSCSQCGFNLIQPLHTRINSKDTQYKCLSCSNIMDFEECLVDAIDQFVSQKQHYNSQFGYPYEEKFCTCPECWTNCYSVEDQICFNCKFEAIQTCGICENSLTGDEISFGVKAYGYRRNKIEKVMRE